MKPIIDLPKAKMSGSMRAHRLLIACILVFASLLSANLEAEEAENAPDYSEGLVKLAALGLPDMEGAKWIAVNPEQMYSMGLHDLERMGIKMKGGGWKLASGKLLVMGSANAVEMPASLKAKAVGETGAAGSMLKNFKEQNPDKVAKAPDSKDVRGLIERDMDLLVEKLSEPENSKNIREMMRYGGFSSGGPLLLLAAQAHAAGQVDEANRLTHKLFSAVGDRRVLIDHVVSTIAEAHYQQIAESFFSNHDWKAYLQGLEKLQKDFPRGWDGRYALAMMVEQVKLRAKGDTPPVPSIKGITLPRKGLELVAAWCKPMPKLSIEEVDLPDGMTLEDIPAEHRAALIERLSGNSNWQYDSQLWSLAAAPESPPKNPIIAVRAMGMDGVITLAALLGDETLTHFPTGGNYGGSYHGSSGSLAARIQQYKQRMSRPLSRGEIATTLLAQVVPSGATDNSFGNQVDPQVLREQAIDFWKKHRNATPTELCAVYLNQGNQEQLNAAAQVLATADDEESAKIFEREILASNDLIAMNNAVTLYLQKKKVKGRAFYDAYAKKMRDTYGQMSEDQLQRLPGGWELARTGVDGQLKQLAVFVGSASVKGLVADALAAENKDNQYWWGISQSLSQMPKSEVLVAIAEAMPKAPIEDRGWLFYMAMSPSDESKPDEAVMKAWKPLLDIVEPIGDSQVLGWSEYFDIHQTNEIAALTLDIIYDQSVSESMRIHYAATTTPIGNLLLERARALVDGKTPPPFISTEGVSEERRVEIAKLAEETPDVMALHGKLAALVPIERAAWLEWYQQQLQGRVAQQNPDSNMPKVLLLARNMIVSVKSEMGDEILTELGLKEGITIEPSKLESMATTLLQKYSGAPSTQLVAKPSRSGLGLDLVIAQPATSQALEAVGQHWEFSNLDMAAEAYATLGFNYQQVEILWQLTGGEVMAVTEKQGDAFRSIKRFEDLMKTNQLYTVPFFITVINHQEYLKHRADD